MQEAKEQLSRREQQHIENALIGLVYEYPNLKGLMIDEVEFNKVIENTPTLSLFTLPGVIKKEEYITGAYIGQYPFQLIYATKPTNTEGRIDRQTKLEILAEWLEGGTSYPGLTGNRAIQKIERTSCVSLAERLENGLELYQIAMNLEYGREV